MRFLGAPQMDGPLRYSISYAQPADAWKPDGNWGLVSGSTLSEDEAVLMILLAMDRSRGSPFPEGRGRRGMG